MTYRLVEAGKFMARRNGSVNPAKFPDEVFELHSIPAFDAGQPEVLRGSEIGSSKQIVQPNDVMISKIVPHIRRSSVVGAGAGKRQIASSEWIVFRSEDLFPHYLRHLLVSDEFNAKFMRTVSGVGGSLLRARPAEVAKIKIPVPPMAEQRRIAAILDKADALRAKRREAIAKLDQLLQSVFLDMFGDPVTNPRGWPVVPFGSVTESRLGKMLDKRTRVGQYMRPYLANINVRWGQFELDNLRQMNFTPDDQREFSLRYGDVLMCEGGEPGRCAIWKEQLQDCYYQKALHRIRCNPAHCVPEYVQWLFWFLAQAGAFRSSIAVATIAHLPSVKLKKLDVPLPPLALQEKFAQNAERIGQVKGALQHSADQFDTLFASLQHRAFTGTL